MPVQAVQMALMTTAVETGSLAEARKAGQVTTGTARTETATGTVTGNSIIAATVVKSMIIANEDAVTVQRTGIATETMAGTGRGYGMVTGTDKGPQAIDRHLPLCVMRLKRVRSTRALCPTF